MVRFGVMSREKGDELIKLNEPTARNLEKSLDSLCALCDFDREGLKKTLVALKQAGVGRFDNW